MIDFIKIFNEKNGIIKQWINNEIRQYEEQKISVNERKFISISKCFSSDFLKNAYAIYVRKIPVIPFHQIGLDMFLEMENENIMGITYLNCFFVKQDEIDNEALHFHELIHVLQWKYLGMDKFLFCYGLGLLEYGYRHSPLEVMAYNHENRFRTGVIYDVESTIAKEMTFFDKLLTDKNFSH
jgi:hypothetical protein